jgi:hypothetical protein
MVAPEPVATPEPAAPAATPEPVATPTPEPEPEVPTQLSAAVPAEPEPPARPEFSGFDGPAQPAQPAAERPPFIPPELLARQPRPHFPPFVRPGDPGTQSQPLTQGHPVQPGPVAPPVQPSAGSTAPPAEKNTRRLALIAGAAVLVVAIVVAVGLVLHNRAGTNAKATTHKPAAVAAVEVKPTKISSFSPHGTGFRSKSDSWTTQNYRSATFGGLKPGLGLVLDLGSARAVSSVEFDAGTGPLTVELRSADQEASNISGYAAVGKSTSASGSTKLDGSGGGKHRYWMIWVTTLGPQDGGYAAEISNIDVRAGT